MAVLERQESVKPRGAARYKIDFALIVLTGNVTRYNILKPLVEKDPDVESRWIPIRTWFKDDPFRFLPGKLRIRARHFADAYRLFFGPPSDATVIHAFETYDQYVKFTRFLRRKTVIVKSPDGGLPRDGRDKYVAEQTDLFVPFSDYARKRIKSQRPEIPDDKIVVIHPGINLDQWRMRAPVEPGERFRLLFVGGDFLRKGGDTLLDAFEQRLSGTCTLDIATQSGHLPAELRTRIEKTSGVTLHLDLTQGSPALRNLFETCDCFVMPTNQDASSWVGIEALATGIPVVICESGGIGEIIQDGKTGLIIPPKDIDAIASVVDRLREDPALRRKLIAQGRAHIEEHFDAAKNTQRLLALVKGLVDQRRASN